MRNISFAKGYHAVISVEDAYRELERIRAETGEITPEDVLTRAEDKESPLHPEIFRESLSDAAKEWRLERCRRLIRSVVVLRPQVPTKPTRAYEIVRAPSMGNANRKAYRTIEDILEDPVARTELLSRALREAAAFRNKYRMLQELAQVFRAIDSFLEKTG